MKRILFTAAVVASTLFAGPANSAPGDTVTVTVDFVTAIKVCPRFGGCYYRYYDHDHIVASSSNVDPIDCHGFGVLAPGQSTGSITARRGQQATCGTQTVTL